MSEGFIDNFSTQSKNYSFSRPTYPQSLFKFLSTVTPRNNLAWDCATGNGQAAIGLAKYFKKVIATDASRNQIRYAFQRENIEYKVSQAENAEIGSDSVDIVTVAQALHWFDFDKFYSNVKRIGKKGAIIAVWSYDMHKIDTQIDKITNRLDVDGDILGSYWDKEARYVKEKYKTITFPFREISVPVFKTMSHWNLHQLWDYMKTWSSVRKYYSENKRDPLELIKSQVIALWGDEFDIKEVTWNLNIRAGVIK